MNNEVFEEMQGAAGGAKAKLEKQARQLAYDTKYKVKQALSAKSGGKADPATVSKMYMAQLSKSPAPPAVKALAKKKLLGEEYVDVGKFAVESVTNALLKVFVEKKEEVVEEFIEEEEKKTRSGEKKYHIKVTDKKTGNSYHRYATRAKIAELRANPNISSVEMSHYGEGETKKAQRDYDGDGKVESSSKEHAGAVHNAIQRRTGGTPDGQDTRKEEVELDEVTKMGVHSPHEVPSKNLKGLVKKAVKRIDADNDGDVDTGDPKEKEMGEFVPSPDGKKKIKPIVQKEDFLSDWRNELFEGKKKDENGEEVIDVMKGKNKITVSPTLGEKMNLAKVDMGDVVKDFYKSDAPQFKGKSKEERRKMAIAAKLTAERGGKKLGEALDTPPKKEKEEKSKVTPDDQKQLQVKKQMLNRKRMLQMQTMQLQKQGRLPLNYSEEVGAVRYCPKCDKDETREECKYGGEYWDENSKPAKVEDPRSVPTVMNLTRNKLRAMGLKMSYDMEGDMTEARKPEVEAQGKKVASYEKAGKYQGITSKFRKENPGSRQPKRVPGAKETQGQAENRRRAQQASRAAKYGLTTKEKKESEARAKYDTPRD